MILLLMRKQKATLFNNILNKLATIIFFYFIYLKQTVKIYSVQLKCKSKNV